MTVQLPQLLSILTLISTRKPMKRRLNLASKALGVSLLAGISCATAIAQQDGQYFFRYQFNGNSPTRNSNPPTEPNASALAVSVQASRTYFTVGESFAASTTVSGSNGPLSFAMVRTSASYGDPHDFGLAINSSDGTVSGHLVVPGSAYFTIIVTEQSTGRTASSQPLLINVAQSTFAYTPVRTTMAGLYSAATASRPFTIARYELVSPSPSWAIIDEYTGTVGGVFSRETAGTDVIFSVRATSPQGQTATGTWTARPIEPIIALSNNRFAGRPGDRFSLTATTNIPPSAGSHDPGPFFAALNEPRLSSVSVNNLTGQTEIVAAAGEYAGTRTEVIHIQATKKSNQAPLSIYAAATAEVRLDIETPLLLSYPPSPGAGGGEITAETGKAFALPAPVTNATPNSATFTVASGRLPNGISLNPTSGIISGTATETGNFSFSVRATSAAVSTEISLSMKVISGQNNRICYYSGGSIASYVVPQYTAMTVEIVGGGGSGGAVAYLPSQKTGVGEDGASSSISFPDATSSYQVASAAGGRGGDTMTYNYQDTDTRNRSNALLLTGGNVTTNEIGRPGAAGLLTVTSLVVV